MGVSPRNLWNMKRFYLQYYQCNTKVQRIVALLPWRHNLLLLGYDLSEEHILFYANEVLNKGWSKDMLNLALKSNYHLSLQDINKPIGVAEFQYLLPKNKLEELITNEIKKRDETI